MSQVHNVTHVRVQSGRVVVLLHLGLPVGLQGGEKPPIVRTCHPCTFLFQVSPHEANQISSESTQLVRTFLTRVDEADVILTFHWCALVLTNALLVPYIASALGRRFDSRER